MNSLTSSSVRVKCIQLTVFTFSIICFSLTTEAARLMEKLGRGVVAVNRGSDIFISWRMFGTEPPSTEFNIYRNGQKINGDPITESTNYVDPDGNSADAYYVTSIINGTESSPSKSVGVWAQQYKTIPLNCPPKGPQGGNYSPNDLSCGDLDGDGEYEIVIKWEPDNAKDNSHQGYTDVTYLEAVKLDGTSLWKIDLGINIRSGAHYTQFMVYDLDSDGRAEVACKTAPGTKDGTGSFLSKGPAANDDHGADYRTGGSWVGFVTDGPEYLTVFDGLTGEELTTVDYIPDRYPSDGWGKSGDNTNRVDRFLACIAYLDGVHPSLVMCRGYYGRTVLAAWDWDGSKLTHRWTFDSNDRGNSGYAGMGNHNIAVGDVDNDGADEIMYGSCAINNDGTGLYTTGLGHGDAGHLSDFDPDRPGLEFFMPHEWDDPGVSFRDAATGEIIWKKGQNAGDVGRGVAGDVHPGHRGAEAWASNGFGIYNSKGETISASEFSMNFLVYWDGDVQRELLDGEVIDNVDANGRVSRLLTAYDFGAAKNNGSKATPGLSADILGDWREEVIWRRSDNKALLLFTTTIPTDRKNYTLMHDPIYRLSVAWQNVSYNQPPHVGYYFADGAPIPDITLVNGEPVQDCEGVLGGTAYIDNCSVCVGGTTGKQPCIQDCNGDWGGEAYNDDCGMCVGGETGVFPCVGSIQGEDASDFDGVIETTNEGYIGEGYLNTTNASGSYGSWIIYAKENITADLTFRYANGSSEDRTASVSVNGIEQHESVSMPYSSAWTTWTTVTIPIDFTQGENVITLTSLTSEGTANIDMITFSNNVLSDGEQSVKTRSINKVADLSIIKNNVSFYLPEASEVTVSLFSVSGRKIRDLFKGRADEGYNSFQLDDKINFASGVFILRMECSTGKRRSLLFTRGL